MVVGISDSSSSSMSASSDEDFVVLKTKKKSEAIDSKAASVDDNDDDDADLAAGNARKTQSLQPNDRDADNNMTSSLIVRPSSSKTFTAANDNRNHQRHVNITTSSPPPTHKQRPPRPRPRLQRSTSTPLNYQSLRSIYNTTNQSFRILRRQSSSLIDSLHSNLVPATPTGWALGALSLCSVGLQYELKLQKELTAPPLVFCQVGSGNNSGGGGGVLNGRMERIYNKLTDNTPNNTTSSSSSSSFKQSNNRSNESTQHNKQGIFSRTVTPSLFIGTRGIVASTAAYALGKHQDDTNVKRVREVMKMGADGALIVLDWEIPLDMNTASSTAQHSSSMNNTIDVTKPNSITKPIILLLHGMNNDSTFGYIRSMMRTATNRGWIAVCMNLRGQDGLHKVKNSTPRGYNAGYTGDLRGVVEQLEYRLKKKRRKSGSGKRASLSNVEGKKNNNNREEEDEEDDYIGGPIYLLGYSLGANIVTKYLGEESLHGTLPKCIGGGAAMGNPLHIHSGTIAFPWNMLLGAGVKRSIVQNATSLRKHHEPGFQHAMKKALLAPTIGKLDDAAAPYLVRNDSHPPYTTRIGFKDGEEYWWESSSHRYVGHVSVPLLKISAQDDFLVFGQFQKKLNHCLENPNVVVVKTRCGGHLGWQESPPPGSNSSGSWSDVAVADFIEALLQIREEDREKRLRLRRGSVNDVDGSSITRPKVMSRL